MHLYTHVCRQPCIGKYVCMWDMNMNIEYYMNITHIYVSIYVCIHVCMCMHVISMYTFRAIFRHT